MTLSTFNPETELRLPASVALSTLSLAEIGAIACFAAGYQGAIPLADMIEARFSTEEMQVACASLKKKGLLTIDFEGGNLSIGIDLEPLDGPE